MKQLFMIISLAGILSQAIAQPTWSTEHGFAVPVKDTIKVMLIFAEVDSTPCGGSNNPTNLWPDGSLPTDANDYFDAYVTDPGFPSGYITKYIHEASWGHYVVLGD